MSKDRVLLEQVARWAWDAAREESIVTWLSADHLSCRAELVRRYDAFKDWWTKAVGRPLLNTPAEAEDLREQLKRAPADVGEAYEQGLAAPLEHIQKLEQELADVKAAREECERQLQAKVSEVGSLQGLLDEVQEELIARTAMLSELILKEADRPQPQEHSLCSDGDGHWFVVPVSQQKAFDDWLAGVRREEFDPDGYPEGVVPLYGGPGRILFQNFKLC